jgi:cysteinyl-tRNA synthetase
LFNVKKYKFYGCLSRRSKDEQIAGSRVEIAKYKKNPEDFILWKPSKENEPSWESPWGLGRPGWHIECSAMSQKCLNIPFDIHCGGVDLTFPHHENEIAQSCSAFSINSDPKAFCNYWFHNGFVTFSGEKMSKSLGNIQLVHDLLKKYSGQVIRYSLISSQYRQPLDWSLNILEQSKKTLLRFYKILNDLSEVQVSKNVESDELFNDFLGSLYDDLNTPKALSVFNGWFNLLRSKDSPRKGQIKSAILRAMEILGLHLDKENVDILNSKLDVDTEIIKSLIKERKIARKNKDFKKADAIRKKLKDLEIELEDTLKGTIWRKV